MKGVSCQIRFEEEMVFGDKWVSSIRELSVLWTERRSLEVLRCFGMQFVMAYRAGYVWTTETSKEKEIGAKIPKIGNK